MNQGGECYSSRGWMDERTDLVQHSSIEQAHGQDDVRNRIKESETSR